MSGLPRVSVVMGTYNSAFHLETTVDSILRQTYTDFEFVIIDDGSTDATWPILQRLAAQDSRIVLHRNAQNLGISATRNLGTELARAELIAITDHDDISLPDRFEKQVAYLVTHPEIGAVGGAIRFMEGERLGEPIEKMPTSELISWAMCFGMPCVHSASMVRRTVLVATGGYDATYKVANDYDLWLRISRQARLANLPDVVLLYNRHGANYSVQQAAMTWQETALIAQRALLEILGIQLSLDELLQIVCFRFIEPHLVGTRCQRVFELAHHFRRSTPLTQSEWRTVKKEAASRCMQLARHQTPWSRHGAPAFYYTMQLDPVVAMQWAVSTIQKSARYRLGFGWLKGTSSRNL
ncbi:MAG: glycosyltransferase family 2 protein [Caldilineaceae bacterium]|nr:glycosyltransferase family 2 protein [Caldilineaceae bacterium]